MKSGHGCPRRSRPSRLESRRGKTHALSCHVLIEDMPPSESARILKQVNDALCGFGIHHTDCPVRTHSLRAFRPGVPDERDHVPSGPFSLNATESSATLSVIPSNRNEFQTYIPWPSGLRHRNLRRVPRPGRERPHPPGHHRNRRPRHADRPGSHRLPQHRIRRLRRHLHPPPRRREEARAQRQDVPRLPPPARRQSDRRRPDRHPAAPALPSTSPPRSTPASTSTRKRRWRSRWITPSACAPPTQGRRQRTVQIGHQWCSSGAGDGRHGVSEDRQTSARSPPSTRTCTATRRTASRSGRGRSIPT